MELPDVIRIQVTHHRGAHRKPAGFELDYQLSASGTTVDDEPDHLRFTSGRLAVAESGIDTRATSSGTLISSSLASCPSTTSTTSPTPST